MRISFPKTFGPKSIYSTLKLSVLGCIFFSMLACAPNNLSIRLAYSRLDNSIYNKLADYATFDKQQRAWIRQMASEYQVWHRRTELPEYARYFDHLAILLASNQVLDRQDMVRMFETFEEFSVRGYTHSPFANSTAFLSQISDRQVEEIAEHFERRNLEWRENILEHERVIGNDERIDRMEKTLSRIGISFNSEQRQILDQGFERYVGKREDRIVAWTKWQRQFLQLLRSRHSGDFIEKMQAHIDVYQRQMQIQYPERSAQNLEIAIDTATQLLNSLTDQQRQQLIATLHKSGGILLSMANSTQSTLL